MTAPARSANAFSSSPTAGISFDLAVTATWPRTVPVPCALAATRRGAFPVLSPAPRTALPSTAMTSRPSARAVLVCSQAPLVAARTTPSADSCTDWASMIPADGSGLRPAARRTTARRPSTRRDVTPSFLHRACIPKTVRYGGKSAGIARHLIPLPAR